MSKRIFDQKGNLTELALKVMEDLEITPAEVLPRPLDSFKSEIKDEVRAKVRYDHFETKRVDRLQKISKEINEYLKKNQL